jgi:two-component system CheB/CheR fusion protein
MLCYIDGISGALPSDLAADHFVDIDSVRRAHHFIESIVLTTPVPLLILDAGLRVQMANEAFYRDFEVSSQETEGRRVYELGKRPMEHPRAAASARAGAAPR